MEREIIQSILREVGVPADLLGHRYIVCALQLINKEPYALHQMTKVVYPTVAKENNSTASRVERAIRHAIERAFDRMPVDVSKEYFGYSINPNSGKATNSQFLAALALELENKLRS